MSLVIGLFADVGFWSCGPAWFLRSGREGGLDFRLDLASRWLLALSAVGLVVNF